jgi:hypothetical protein
MSYRTDDPIPIFIFAMIDKTTGEVSASYVAEDPPWANNGPTIVNPLGRIQALAKARIPKGLELADEIESWADFDEWEKDPRNARLIAKELARPISQEEKNRDMALIPHPFPGVDTSRYAVVVVSPTDCRLCRGLRARHKYGGDSVNDMLRKYMEIDNTPIEGLKTPNGVLAVQARLKSNR